MSTGTRLALHMWSVLQTKFVYNEKAIYEGKVQKVWTPRENMAMNQYEIASNSTHHSLLVLLRQSGISPLNGRKSGRKLRNISRVKLPWLPEVLFKYILELLAVRGESGKRATWTKWSASFIVLSQFALKQNL